jgi:hypothetical protein
MTRSSVSVSDWHSETHEYFWNVCPELTARWKRAMLTLSPAVLQDLGTKVQHLEAVTNTANRYLHAAHVEDEAGDVPVEDLLDRALASMERLSEAADTMTRLLDELLQT